MIDIVELYDVLHILPNLAGNPKLTVPPGAIQHEDRLAHGMRFQRTEREEFHGTHRHEVQIIPPWRSLWREFFTRTSGDQDESKL